MKKTILISAVAGLALVFVGSALRKPALAAERVEESTIIGKDKSAQAGQIPSDTRAASPESKMKQEQSPAGLQSSAPGVRTQEKMQKPRMSEPERKKPEQKKGFGNFPWIWLLVIGGLAAAAG